MVRRITWALEPRQIRSEDAAELEASESSPLRGYPSRLIQREVDCADQLRYTVAIANVFGSNAFDVVLLVLVEVLYRGGTILERSEPSVVFVATVGSIMTCIYLWGLMERENRTVFGIGRDSAGAVLIYVGAMAALYFLR